MTAEELWDAYTERSQEDGVSLEDFLEEYATRATSGAVATFLRHVESTMLANIETKLEESPHLHEMRDEAVERTQEWIAGLLARYAQEPRT